MPAKVFELNTLNKKSSIADQHNRAVFDALYHTIRYQLWSREPIKPSTETVKLSRKKTKAEDKFSFFSNQTQNQTRHPIIRIEPV